MENSLKGLILAAGTIITCVIVTLGFYISREAKEAASNGAGQINRLNMEFLENDKALYDGAKISGSEVINVIKKMSEEKIGVYVSTGKANTFYGYAFDLTSGELGSSNNNKYTLALDNTTSAYINPYGNFSGKVIRDANNVITGIVFTQ